MNPLWVVYNVNDNQFCNERWTTFDEAKLQAVNLANEYHPKIFAVLQAIGYAQLPEVWNPI